jgi:hypothetical protein
MSFDDHPTSTKTLIVYTTINADIDKIYSERVFPIEPYVLVQKKRGRKKKTTDEDPNKDLKEGSVVHVNYKDSFYGFTPNPVPPEFFRNSTTIIIYIENKLINFKLSRKGTLQMTGCKSLAQAKKCVNYFWSHLSKHPDKFTYKPGESTFTAYYDFVMKNIKFNIGFKIDREAFNEYINRNTSHNSIFETTIGYAGVNVKFEADSKFDNDFEVTYDMYGITHTEGRISYSDLANRMKIRTKKRYITFLVFQSGVVIMSGKDSIYMQDPYTEFMKIVTDNRATLEEKVMDAHHAV